MKLQIVRQYTDLQFNKNMTVGEIIEVDTERAKILIDKDYAFSVEVVKPEVVKPEVVAPKKIRANAKRVS